MLIRNTWKVRGVSGIALVISLAGSKGTSNPRDCTSENGSECVHAVGVPISEVPEGVIDGKNSTFSVDKTPSSDVPLRLYRNGLLLIPNVDYYISRQKLIIAPSQVPTGGDVLQAVYVPNLMARTELTPGKELRASSLAIGYASEIANTAVEAALQTEEERAQHAGIATGDSSTGSGQTFLVPGESSSPESLRMLGIRVAAPKRYSRSPESANFPNDVTAQGVDGLGDGPIKPLFGDTLQKWNESIVTETDSGRSATLSRNSDIESSPGSPNSAIEMLQKRLRPKLAQKTKGPTF
jgi:hypothetical protein